MKLTVQGFIILDYASRFPEGRAYLADLRSKGKIDYAYHVTEGLENCVNALEEVFAGKNYGKAYVPSLLQYTGCELMSRVVKIGQDERGAKL